MPGLKLNWPADNAIDGVCESTCEGVGEEPPIPCAGRRVNTTDGDDFDCDYEHAGSVTCDQCVVNGGRLDPRTGRKFRRKLA